MLSMDGDFVSLYYLQERQAKAGQRGACRAIYINLERILKAGDSRSWPACCCCCFLSLLLSAATACRCSCLLLLMFTASMAYC